MAVLYWKPCYNEACYNEVGLYAKIQFSCDVAKLFWCLEKSLDYNLYGFYGTSVT